MTNAEAVSKERAPRKTRVTITVRACPGEAADVPDEFNHASDAYTLRGEGEKDRISLATYEFDINPLNQELVIESIKEWLSEIYDHPDRAPF